MLNKYINDINNLNEKIDKIDTIGGELCLYYNNSNENNELHDKVLETIEKLKDSKKESLEEIKVIADKIGAEIKESKNNKSLKQLKDDVNRRDIKLKMIYNDYWGGNRKKYINVIREIESSQNNGLYLKCEDSRPSWLQYPKAKDMRYTEKYLVLYNLLKPESVEIIYEIIRED